MIDLFSRMNSDINRLVLDALKVSVSKPRQLSFLRSFMKNLGIAEARRGEHERNDLHVPPFLIASITSSCNLFCTGCYSRANQSCCGGASGKPLPTLRWDELFTEAKQLGICFILLAGGEPLLRPDVLEAAAKHPEIIFPVFTNGTLLDEKAIDLFDSHRNLLPVISLEGGQDTTDKRRGEGVYGKIMKSLGLLKSRKVMFGVSITVTRQNMPDVTGLGFVKGLRKLGCGLVFYVEYVPSDMTSKDMAPTGVERKLMEESILQLRESAKMMIISFPGDEKESGGCLAAGRGFVHINMDGSVEPCPFSPYSDTNLADITLAEALRSPFLTRMREDGFLLGEHDGGCLLFERQEAVRKMLDECKTAAM